MDPESLLEELARSTSLAPFRELVAPLEAYDAKHNSDLVHTVRVFFAANTNASEAADRLFMHRNSLRYRLERIEGLVGLDLRDYRARLALQLGLLALTKERSESDEDERPQQASRHDHGDSKG